MERKYLNIVKHLENCLKVHGDTHLGMDWPNLEDLKKRYAIMLDVIRFRQDRTGKPIDLLDFGCGASYLYGYIQDKQLGDIRYSGLDISQDFIELSKKKYPDIEYYCLDILDSNHQIRNFDYVVLNGVFTVKRDLSFEDMFEYFKKMIEKVYSIANKGIAFNVMSKHVDWEREDLFHLPHDLLADFLIKSITRNFIMRNDYGLYEYTTYVYK